MELKVIVMITTLVLPGGDAGVHVKPFTDNASCIAAADIEASDPFVHAVECAELDDGVLQLRFAPQQGADGQSLAGRPAG